MPRRRLAQPVVLDALESVATANGRVEKLNPIEFAMLEQLIRYPDEGISRDSLRNVAGYEDQSSLPDRRLDSWLRTLIRKTNVLNPDFPVVRDDGSGNYLYSLKPPPKKPRD